MAGTATPADNGAPKIGGANTKVQPGIMDFLSWDDVNGMVNSGRNKVLGGLSKGVVGMNKSGSLTFGGFASADFAFMFIGGVLVIVGIVIAVFQTKTAQEIIVQPVVSTAKTAAKAAVAGAIA